MSTEYDDLKMEFRTDDDDKSKTDEIDDETKIEAKIDDKSKIEAKIDDKSTEINDNNKNEKNDIKNKKKHKRRKEKKCQEKKCRHKENCIGCLYNVFDRFVSCFELIIKSIQGLISRVPNTQLLNIGSILMSIFRKK
uniref:Uncharacterized protein n=1 Tax=Metapenaeus joyneri majanivirus TaxID=2984280 RepID=A0A9C7BIC8_9VIRU|nr:MAG: hypothetical protein [Metapenaeus joyneri majanivirus]